MSSSADSVFLSAPVTTVAAILTVFEFFIGTLSAILARSTIHGFALLVLHLKGSLTLTKKARHHRKLLKDLSSFLIGVWIAIGIALVESGLETSYRISEETTSPEFCVRLDTQFPQDVFAEVQPPRSVRAQEWGLEVSRNIGCGNNGLMTVYRGVNYDSLGQVKELFAPRCATPESGFGGTAALNNSKAILKTLIYARPSFQFERGFTPLFEVIPYSIKELFENFRDSNVSAARPDVELFSCMAKNISSYTMFLRRRWATDQLESADAHDIIHHRLCQAHESSVDVIPTDKVGTCFSPRQRQIDSDCVRSVMRSLNMTSHSTVLSNVTALFGGQFENSSSYACVDATVRYTYTFMDTKAFIGGAILNRKPVLLPLSVEAITGTCERGIHFYSRAALLHSAAAEWENNIYVQLDRTVRYHALLLMTAETMLPSVSTESYIDADSRNCTLRRISSGTQVEKNWKLWVLISGLVVCGVVMMAGLMSRVLFRGNSWRVGTTEWSLERYMEREYGRVRTISTVETQEWSAADRGLASKVRNRSAVSRDYEINFRD